MERFSSALREAAEPIWRAQHEHPFVRGLGDGTLDAAKFRHYIRQDYLFLGEYGRVLALASARAPRLAEQARFAELAQSILTTEMELHRAYAAEWGVSAEQLGQEEMAPTTRAYTDFLLRTATLGDFAELVAALLPCMWGYQEVGAALAERRPQHELYARWVDMYAGDDFAELARWCRQLTDAVAADVAGGGRERMRQAFLTSSRYELAFWEMAWREERGDAPMSSRPTSEAS